MSETETGSSEAPVFGKAADLRAAGFVEMPDSEKKKDEGELTVQEAADLAKQQTGEIVERSYLDEAAEPVDGKEAVTIERAARDLTNIRNAEREAIEAELNEQIANEADDLRGKTEKPEAAPIQEQPAPPADEADEVERALQNPRVREAIEQQLGQAEATRQAYADAMKAATDLAAVSFMEQFPELAALSEHEREPALRVMAQQDPAKYARVVALVHRAGQLQAFQQQEKQRADQREADEFRSYSQKENERYEAMVANEPEDTQRAVEREIIAAAKEYGIETADFIHLCKTERVMRNAAFQKFMYDFGKFRLQEKRRATLPRGVPKVPPVQRPGTSSRVSHEEGRMRLVSGKFEKNPSLANAAALLAARRAKAS